ncbi:MAG: hypothetical protein JXN59_14495 [Anaerolineae bacterium]|nr:hypothetical protein [Anaerolineae bacterium]
MNGKRVLVLLSSGAIIVAAGAIVLITSFSGSPGAPAFGGPGDGVAQAGALITTLTPTHEPSPTLSPTPNPTATTAAAHFTLERAEMVSRYPEGAEYIFRASSDAGPVERVQLRTWTREGSRSSTTLEWDEERQAFVHFDRMSDPPWFEINYNFSATDSAGNRYFTPDLKGEYADHTRKWLRRENEDVIVLLFGARESLADDLFTTTAQAMKVLQGAFGFELDYKPYVVVMPDQASFEEWQEYPDPYLAGLTMSNRGYTIQTLQWGEGDLVDTTVPHELTHIFQGFIAEARDIPAWFTEGNASYFEPVTQYDYEQRVRDLATRPEFPTLQGHISTEYPGPDGRNRWVYDIGYSFMRYWIATYGWESHQTFWQAQTKHDFEEAMELATGVSFPELEAEWRAYIGAPGLAPTLIPSPTLRPFPTAPGMPASGG